MHFEKNWADSFKLVYFGRQPALFDHRGVNPLGWRHRYLR